MFPSESYLHGTPGILLPLGPPSPVSALLDEANTNQDTPLETPFQELEPTNSQLLAIYTNPDTSQAPANSLTTSSKFLDAIEAAAEDNTETDDGEDECIGPCLFFDGGPG